MRRRAFLALLAGVVVAPRALLRVPPYTRRPINVDAMRAVEARILLPGIQDNYFKMQPLMRLLRERR